MAIVENEANNTNCVGCETTLWKIWFLMKYSFIHLFANASDSICYKMCAMHAIKRCSFSHIIH